ncbi:hypothetical protein [Herbiconiux ginsengi]|uniref:Uncharacterized protein n=1 Tax=Herbiconiux ginsengi TaxID=381665 RepID=A0A1H3SNX7_9MICO|nr:hypothetical protein [Herbiconiux ginsengi]SDZ39696.1 hypothetical protein SAMN05216554_3543 [Herbiconiux ginsengi]
MTVLAGYGRAGRWAVPAALFVSAAIAFWVTPQVDEFTSVRLGFGITVSQGFLMRAIALLQVIAGIWVAIRPRFDAIIATFIAAGAGLDMLRRLQHPALIDIGAITIDARIVIVILELTALVFAAALALSRTATLWARRQHNQRIK